ncbi:MAG: hypothetical protein ABIH90_01600 [Candidatus Aenigmatarchaeota archaeon]
MKFAKENAMIFESGGVKGWVYMTKDDFPEMSCTMEEVTGKHGKLTSSND